MNVEQRLDAERQLLEKLRDHKGEWVAIRDSDIVAAAPTQEQLREQISLGDIDSYFEVASDESTIHIL